MRIIIIGCGRVGSRIALELSQNGNEVSVVDRNPLAFDKLLGAFNGNMIVGTGIDEDTLISAGIENAHSVISVTKGDNTNIMVGQIAKFLFKVPNVIVRTSDPKNKEFYESEFELSCYCPTEISSQNYIRLMKGE